MKKLIAIAALSVMTAACATALTPADHAKLDAAIQASEEAKEAAAAAQALASQTATSAEKSSRIYSKSMQK